MAKKFEVTILGVNSAFPIHGRHPSCQIVNYDDHLLMIDCGEAAQIQIAKYHIKAGKINHIFISHLHGDHCYGLPGLLTSYALKGRKKKLELHGPFGIRKYIDGVFEVSGAIMPYELLIHEYDTEVEHTIVVNKSITVQTFPMKHRIPTMGFKVREVIDEWNIDSAAIQSYKLSIDEIKSAKRGEDVHRNGRVITNNKLTLPKPKPRTYAYCSDTIYDPDIVPHIRDCDQIYHETTYLDDLLELAEERMHATLGQAIDIAQQANVQKLIIGHYSSRYKDVHVFLEQGLPHFAGLLLGVEGRVYPL